MRILKKFLSSLMKTVSIILAMCLPLFMLNTAFAAGRVNVVYMYDNYYVPKTLTILAGQSVKWINRGSHPHTVTSDGGRFNSGRIRPGGSVTYMFTRPGIYHYTCTLHTFLFFGMKGKIIVR